MFSITTSTRKIGRLKKKIRAIQGGTSASKTISVLLILIDLAQKDKSPTLTSIVSESLPHLKRGAIRDFKKIMTSHGYWRDGSWNASDRVYTFETGSQIEFFGADNSEKLRGGRRDRGFINECNNVSLEAFDEFEVRTREFVFLDWNPTNEFWFYTDVLGKREDVDLVIVNYLDNEALDQATRQSIENRKNRIGWYKVYGLGELGQVEGQIYKDWRIVDEVPHEARLIGYGLDFGYTHDPSSLVAIYYLNGGYILKEICFTKGLSNRQIADIIKAHPPAPVTADSAEPKSIDELRLYGITILPATKGKGSVSQGIQFVQDQRISVTKDSVNVLKEQRNYLWKTDDHGKVTDEPEHQFSHSMDAIRYGLQIKWSKEPDSTYTQPQYESAGLSEPARGSILEEVSEDFERPKRRVP